MFQALRTKFGIPGLISVLALVFVMGGAAYAAKKYVITSTAQIKPSVLKSLKGKAGPAGANGTNGANGKDGINGKDGARGEAGSPGTPGKSVLTAAATTTPSGECPTVGGTKLEVEGSGTARHVCNGKEGPPGPTCEGGACLLPSEATETGVWSAADSGGSEALAQISFPLRLSVAPTSDFFVTKAEVQGGTAPAGCPGSFGSPEAEPGVLCVYEKFNFGFQSSPSFLEIDETSGTVLHLFVEVGETEAAAVGSWAVTAS